MHNLSKMIVLASAVVGLGLGCTSAATAASLPWRGAGTSGANSTQRLADCPVGTPIWWCIDQ